MFACQHSLVTRSYYVSYVVFGRLLASLQHPNLVQYNEAFVDHGKLCIVTELMPGGDLATAMYVVSARMTVTI